MADLPRAQLLGRGREPEKGSDPPLGQEPDGLLRRVDGPGDVLPGGQADVGRDAGEEGVLGALKIRDTRDLTFEVGEPSHPLCGDDFETSRVHTGEEHHGVPLVQPDDVGSHEVQAEVRLPRHE
jgi:hypothetical protein